MAGNISNPLAMPDNKRVVMPDREPDLVSKRGVQYWFSPEWVRDGTGAARIKPIKNNNKVDLYMLSKAGKLNYIQGSIQVQFHRWHEDRQIDCILLGVEEGDVLLTDWEYEDAK